MNRSVLHTLGYCVGAAAFMRLGFAFRIGIEGACPFWPVAGFALAVFLLVPTRTWPWLVVAGVIAHSAVKAIVEGVPFVNSLVTEWTGQVEPLLAASVLRYATSFDLALRRTRDFLLLAGVALFIATPVASAIGTASMIYQHPEFDFWPVFQTWSLGDSLGILIFAPPVLAMARNDPWTATRREALETLAFATVTVLVAVVGLGGLGTIHPTLAAYLASPALCYAAFRYGLRGTSFAAVFLTTTAVASAVFAARIAERNHLPHESVLTSLQVFGFVAVAMVLLAVALDEQRRRAEEHLRLERTLRTAQKFEALGRLSSGVAHDFNNVLAAIMATAELVQQRRDVEVVHDLAEDILVAATRGADIVRQLSMVGTHEAAATSGCSADALLHREAPMLRRLLPEGSDFDLRVDGENIAVGMDEVQLSRIVMNLVINARDASPPRASIRVELRRWAHPADVVADHRPSTLLPLTLPAGRYASLAVADDGHGMDAEVMARLFEPFFTTKDVGHGTGLGLATSYGMVAAANGAIVASSAPGRGTTMRVLLPLAARIETATPPHAA
jgi:signal transduction histidine kinase